MDEKPLAVLLGKLLNSDNYPTWRFYSGVTDDEENGGDELNIDNGEENV